MERREERVGRRGVVLAGVRREHARGREDGIRFAPSAAECRGTESRARTERREAAGGRYGHAAGGSRRGEETEGGSTTIRHNEPAELDRTETLFALHAQFVEAGLAKGGTAGELDFPCLANRARTRGRNPGGLLRRLLELGRTDWITYADEEVATRRMRERWSGPSLSTILPINQPNRWGSATTTTTPPRASRSRLATCPTAALRA
jgi:hypothetical protein